MAVRLATDGLRIGWRRLVGERIMGRVCRFCLVMRLWSNVVKRKRIGILGVVWKSCRACWA